jgi:hypothetical protein
VHPRLLQRIGTVQPERRGDTPSPVSPLQTGVELSPGRDWPFPLARARAVPGLRPGGGRRVVERAQRGSVDAGAATARPGAARSARTAHVPRTTGRACRSPRLRETDPRTTRPTARWAAVQADLAAGRGSSCFRLWFTAAPSANAVADVVNFNCRPARSCSRMTERVCLATFTCGCARSASPGCGPQGCVPTRCNRMIRPIRQLPSSDRQPRWTRTAPT